jgi:hypothetical protein
MTVYIATVCNNDRFDYENSSNKKSIIQHLLQVFPVLLFANCNLFGNIEKK